MGPTFWPFVSFLPLLPFFLHFSPSVRLSPTFCTLWVLSGRGGLSWAGGWFGEAW